MYFADVCLSEEEHTDTGLSDTTADRVRKFLIEDGFLDNIFHVLSLEAELEELSMDASIVKAHQHSAGAKKGGQQI